MSQLATVRTVADLRAQVSAWKGEGLRVGAVDRNGGVPPYSETRRYVERVGQLADRYRSALASAP